MGHDILYDSYDENMMPVGMIFAKDCKELLQIQPKVKYVLGMDYLTRETTWFEVRETGLYPVHFDKR
ncbi:MAG: hypothetical protein II364_03660 [Bacteroidales bacterium]|nr:hypothetical protein [Bacteroidales bacterium]